MDNNQKRKKLKMFNKFNNFNSQLNEDYLKQFSKLRMMILNFLNNNVKINKKIIKTIIIMKTKTTIKIIQKIVRK